MRRYHKWLMTLGIAAATPGLTYAGPLSFFSSKSPAPAAATNSAKRSNQQVAEDIAKAIRTARLESYDIDVQFQNGTCTLSGSVATPEQKTAAYKAASQVAGVKSVDNRLAVKPKGAPSAAPTTAAKSPSSNPFAPRTTPTAPAGNPFEPPTAPQSPRTSPIQRVQFEETSAGSPQSALFETASAPKSVDNQTLANNCAAALKQAQFKGFNIEIQCQNGICQLSGTVSSQAQKSAATSIVSKVPGVKMVENELTVAATKAAPTAKSPAPPAASRPTQTIQPTQYASEMPALPQRAMPAGPYAAYPGAHPGMMPAAMMAPPQGPYGPPVSGAAHMVYDQPNLPDHAWPSYAAYPNYAAVSYPTMYSASAWPYIGPFYPYPQVPLGWRKAQLEWDDGYWHLNFRPRTERWWWFFNPQNW